MTDNKVSLEVLTDSLLEGKIGVEVNTSKLLWISFSIVLLLACW